MKLFLSIQENSSTQAKIFDIDRVLTDLGVIVFTPKDKSNISNNISFSRLDGLVIAGGENNQDAGYLIALAISQKKPILYLLEKGQALPDELLYIKNNNDVSKYLIVKYYNDCNIKTKITEFLDLIENGDCRWDAPSVKFTWRITPRIERYLRWKTSVSGKTKATWLRNHIVKEIIMKDVEYQRFLQSD
ncbi:MAG: hypothetical protein ACKKL6_01445 [Candidatus Komeilibacteria bacterium]